MSERLDNILKSNNAVLSSSHDKIYRKTLIEFICNCGNNASKLMTNIIRYGAYCVDCTRAEKKAKIIKNNIEKHGCEYAFQAKSVKEKIKKLCLNDTV
jgi:hypothetical protein